MNFRRWFKNSLALLAMIAFCCTLTPVSLTLAQSSPTPGPAPTPAPVPAWAKDLPVYAGLDKLEFDNGLLTVLGIKPEQVFIQQIGLTADSLDTMTGDYSTKLAGQGWTLKNKRGFPTEAMAQQLTFSNPKFPDAQLMVLAATKNVLSLVPQLKAFDAKVPAGKNILAVIVPLVNLNELASPTSPAPVTKTPVGEQSKIAAPAWFASLPKYDLKDLSVNQSVLGGLGIDTTGIFYRAGLTADPVKKVSDFYTGQLKDMGWPAPAKSNILTDDLGQVLDFQDGKLTILIASKAALELTPQTKSLSSQIPDGQTVVVLLTQVDAAPRPGTACQPGAECQVGPYKLKISLDRTSFNTTNSFVATVERLDQSGGEWKLAAEVVPSKSTSATPVQFNGDFERGTANPRQIKMDFPISGNWYIYLTVKDAGGEAVAYIPAVVDPPTVMDARLAWLIGLSPGLGVVGFAFGQWRMIRRRKQDERAAAETLPTPAEPETAEPVKV